MSNYIDLEPQVSVYYGTIPGQERRAGICDALRYLDSHPDQVPERTITERDRDWWVANANVNDAEDCEACEGDLCPVHYGISMGIDLMAKKIAALGDDPELFALIPDPEKAPGGAACGCGCGDENHD